MRLLNTETLAFEEFMDESNIPAYAVLSHTWGLEEISYQDISNGIPAAVEQKAGFVKIILTCQQARAEGLKLCWTDTCCIDKTSSAELSEAINSMFRWYSRSAVCYAYLDDVKVASSIPSDLGRSRWFTRGWTLQELIAPERVEFYGVDWIHFGSSRQLAEPLSKITGIDTDILRRRCAIHDVCVARRMSWAAGRCTTRVEDVAYSLLGIFDVNMPLLYGEGQKAFYRLQKRIIRDSRDDSILAWDHQHPYDHVRFSTSLLAPSPSYFRDCRNVSHCRPIGWDDMDLTNNGLRLKTHYLRGMALKQLYRRGPVSRRSEVAILNCYREDEPNLRVALCLQRYMQHNDADEKAYYICSGVRGNSDYRDAWTKEPTSLHTRLVLVDRSGGQSSVTRETNLITKTVLQQQTSFRLNITIRSEHRLGICKVMRLPQSPENDDLPPSRTEATPHLSQSFEVAKGSAWSGSVAAPNQRKFIVGGAKIHDDVSKQSFFLLCTYQNPYVSPEWANDGDYGVELLCALDNNHRTPNADPNGPGEDLAFVLAQIRGRAARSVQRSRKSTMELPGAGTITALANVSDFEGLMMNVTVSLTAKTASASEELKSGRLRRSMSERLPKKIASMGEVAATENRR